MKRTIRPTFGHCALLCLVGPIVGGLLGLMAGFLFELAISSPWLAVNGMFGLGEYVGEPLMLLIMAGVGATAGAIFAATMLGESLRITVTERDIEVSWDNARVSVPAAMVQSVVIDEDIVILGEDGIELSRVRNDVNSRELIDALIDAGYSSILTRDPYDNEFRAEEDHRGLAEDAQKLLAARACAIRNGAHGDAELLRRRLASHGVMVRDIHRRGLRPLRQQWRLGTARDRFPEFAFIA